MKNEHGFTMPGTLVLLFLLFSFFIYEVNALVTDQMFYEEAETLFILDEVMQQAVIDVKDGVIEGEGQGEVFYSYESGDVIGSYVVEERVVFITLQCIVKGNQSYTVNFQYNKENGSITNWRETTS
ncbi:competence type IV pilus minor pilin ComGG [Bacillus manliponensis]|uniref:competence type IV pilus minor pilin ComGG n=1 Tax=Bacillus manliponensis TaxID=574376 RepID=UPI0035135318